VATDYHTFSYTGLDFSPLRQKAYYLSMVPGYGL